MKSKIDVSEGIDVTKTSASKDFVATGIFQTKGLGFDQLPVTTLRILLYQIFMVLIVVVLSLELTKNKAIYIIGDIGIDNGKFQYP